MNRQPSREDTYMRNISQINALVDYVRHAGITALNAYQKDKMLNLTVRQLTLLGTVLRKAQQTGEDVTVGSLARELHMSISAVSHLADTLEAQQLMHRYAHGEDRRSVCVALSPTGEECANVARQGMLDAIYRLTAELTPEEEELRLRVIDKLYHTAYPAA